MKKLLFSLMALVFFNASFGQTLSAEQHKKITNSQMVALVNLSKGFYKTGQTYDGFLQALMIPSPTFPSQDQLFKKVYSYVSTNAADCDIIKGDNSVLATFSQDIAKSDRNHTTYEKAFGPPKKWWMIAINWIVNAAAVTFAEVNNLPTPPTVDLFPNYGGTP